MRILAMVQGEPPPRFAEHTDAVLARHGFSEAEIAALREDGALVEARRR